MVSATPILNRRLHSKVGTRPCLAQGLVLFSCFIALGVYNKNWTRGQHSPKDLELESTPLVLLCKLSF